MTKILFMVLGQSFALDGLQPWEEMLVVPVALKSGNAWGAPFLIPKASQLAESKASPLLWKNQQIVNKILPTLYRL